MSVHPSARLSVRLSVRPSVRPSVSQSVSPSISPSVYWSARLSICPSVCHLGGGGSGGEAFASSQKSVIHALIRSGSGLLGITVWGCAFGQGGSEHDWNRLQICEQYHDKKGQLPQLEGAIDHAAFSLVFPAHTHCSHVCSKVLPFMRPVL